MVLAALFSACGGEGGVTVPSATGPVDAEAAGRAVLALCEIATDHTDDLKTAGAVFQDRSHETLHAIAAAVEEVDRVAAADLLTAKQRVEADLASDELPVGFAGDVDALVSATARALEAIGMSVPPCPA